MADAQGEGRGGEMHSDDEAPAGTPMDPAEVDAETGGAGAADLDADLWGPPSGNGNGTDLRVVVVVIGVVIILGLGFVLFDGGSESSSSTSKTTGTASTLVPPAADVASTAPGDDATTQLTSQSAPDDAATLTPSTLPAGAVPRGCGDWDAAFNVAPDEVTEGVYIWSDFEGWHVRLAGDAPGSIAGSVSGQVLPELYSPPDAPGVETTIDEGANRLSFELTGGDQPVGIDFNAGCEQQALTFELTSDGAPVPVEQIHLGKRGVVVELPLVARRTLPDPG